MTILTKNQIPVKGQKAEFELDKDELANIASVQLDSYFSDKTNWKYVSLVYRSIPGNQRKVVKFDVTNPGTTSISYFYSTAKAKNSFELRRIVIDDFDGGRFFLSRNYLVSQSVDMAEFDIDMSTMIAYERFNFSTVNNLPLDKFEMFMDSGDSIYSILAGEAVYQTPGARIGGKSVDSAVINLADNTYNNTISQFINDTRTRAVAFKPDMTKAYCIGYFNGEFAGQTFASPLGANGVQIVEVNLADGAVSYIDTISVSMQAPVGLSFISNKLLISSDPIILYDLLTNSVVWSKSTGYSVPAKVAGSYFYTLTNSYDGVSIGSFSIIKCAIADGVRDISLPTQNASELDSGAQFDVAPDGKIVLIGSSGTGFSYWNNTSWAFVAGIGGKAEFCSFDSTNSKAYISFTYPEYSYPYTSTTESYIAQYDLSAFSASVILNNMGLYTSGDSPIKFVFARDNKLFLIKRRITAEETGPSLLAYNITGTSATSVAISDVYVNTSTSITYAVSIDAVSDKLIVRSTSAGSSFGQDAVSSATTVSPEYGPSKIYFAKYNIASGEVDSALALIDALPPGSSVPPSNWYNRADLPKLIHETPLLPNKILLMHENKILESNKSTYPFSFQDTGWPTIPAAHDFLVSGDFIYLSASSGNPIMTLSDSGGDFTTYGIARISILTKLIDRTFKPGGTHPSSDPGFFTSIPVIGSRLSESDNHIYMSYKDSIYGYDTFKNVFRVKKSDSTSENFSGLLFIQNFSGSVFSNASNGKLIAMPYWAAMLGNQGEATKYPSNLPYVIIDEVTMTAEATQPAPIAMPGVGTPQTAVMSAAMSPFDGLIYQVGCSAQYGYSGGPYTLFKYDPINLTHISKAYKIASSDITEFSIMNTEIMFTQAGEPYILVHGVEDGRYVYGFRKINNDLTIDGDQVMTPPMSLSATPLSGQINLSWAPVSGATSYKIYRGTVSGSLTLLTTVGAPNFTYNDVTTTNGTEYFYAVTSLNSSVESAQSPEISAEYNPPAPPATPTNFAATASSGQVDLSWDAVTGAASYKIYRGTVSGSLTLLTTVTAPTVVYSDTTVTNGTQYFYTVSSFDGSLESAQSSEVSATPTVSSTTNVNWIFQDPHNMQSYGSDGGLNRTSIAGFSSAKGTAVTGNFTLTYKVILSNGAYWLGYAKSNIDLSLNNNADRVVYYNGNSVSPFWGSLGDGVTSFQWDEVCSIFSFSSNAAPAIDQLYTVTYQRVGSAITCIMNNGTSSDTFDVENYSGTVYPWIMLDSTNLNSELEYAKLVVSPATPTNFAATASSGQVDLSWDAVTGATSYKIYRGTVSGSLTLLTTVTAPTVVYSDTTATNGTQYFYTVSSFNGTAESAQSSEVSATPTVSPANNILWVFENTSYMAPYGTDGGIEVLSGATPSWAQAKSAALTGDFTLEYKVTLTSSHFLLGYSKSDITLGTDPSPERCAYFNPINYTWTDADDAQADPWVNAMNIGESSPSAATGNGQLYTVKFERVGGLITATMNNGTSSATFTVESSYTGAVYPHIALWSAAGTKLEFGKVTGVQSSADLWNFSSNPNYSVNGQNEIVSSYAFVDADVNKILFSKNAYAIPINGLELKLKADNGFLLSSGDFFGASDLIISVFGGFATFASNYSGVQNTFTTSYTYPITSEVEWKIIIKPTETLFYVNNSLVNSSANIVNSQSIYLNLRFDNSHNVKEYSLTAL